MRKIKVAQCTRRERAARDRWLRKQVSDTGLRKKSVSDSFGSPNAVTHENTRNQPLGLNYYTCRMMNVARALPSFLTPHRHHDD